VDLVGLSELSLLLKVSTLCLVNLLLHSQNNNLSLVITPNPEMKVVMAVYKKMLLTTLKHTVSSLKVITNTPLVVVEELSVNHLVSKPMVK